MRFSKEFTLSAEDYWKGLAVGRGMNTADDLSLSPASDCNSNNVETSYTSNTSELEFIQDNSDYQWCIDYGYREVSHRSVLSSCYDELAKDLDSQLAQVDMEDYSAQEILSTLPVICCPDIQAERQGEMFASVSGSLMVKFDFDSSISPHTSSQDESSMSLCHSEPLFSPVKEAALPNYSVDSLDEGEQLIVTCQANKTNYTIAFHGSTVMGDTSEYTDTGDSMMSVEDKNETKMAASDAPTTTWSKLRSNPRGRRSRSKTVSLPDLGQGNPGLSASLAIGGCVKLYDVQNSGSVTSESFSGSGPDVTGTGKQGNFSLLRMFIAQRANSADQNMENRFNVNNNNSIERDGPEKVTTGTGMSGISDFSGGTSSSDPTGETKMCPLHTVDRAIQTSVREPAPVNKEESGQEEKKPVYVLYPNYTLPDLGFLRGGQGAERVLLAPVKYTTIRSPGTPPGVAETHLPFRTVTKRDLDSLRQKGLDHVMDWSSLTPLLPSEYWSLLCELPQVRQHSASRLEKPAFATSHHPTNKESNAHNYGTRTTNVNSSDSANSTATAPSSGYRGSSTLLSESGGPTNTPACNTPANNPLYVYNYSAEEKKLKKGQEGKRYSMFEFSGLEDNLPETDPARKRKSFPIQQHKDKEDEGSESWDDWWRDTTKRPHSPPSAHANRLDQLLELSGGEVSWQPQDIKILRDQVSKFLSETGRKCVSFADKGDQLTPPNSPTYQKTYHCKQGGLTEIKQFPEEVCRSRYDFANKKKLLERVVRGVEKVMEAASSEGCEGDSLSAAVLDSLCPPLYSLLLDGLRPKIDTAFGPIGNSVWQVVEASAQQGPMTRALHELVMKLNSEDILSEGLIKFNAFIFGLLNVHGMDAWMSYIRTRESILSKHYTEESLLLSASRGHAKSRALTDSLIASLRPLSRLPFRLDLLYETRLLHESLLQLAKLPLSPSSNSDVTTDSFLLKKIVQSIKSGLSGGTLSGDEPSQSSEGSGVAPVGRSARPRSCVDPGSIQTQDIAATARKRWSTVHVGSRLASAYDRLQSPGSQDANKTIESGSARSSGSDDSIELDDDGKKTGGKFRSLQRKWELLSGKSQDNKTRIPRSRIPRPVTSPVRPVTMRVPTPASLQRRALSSIPTQRSSSREVLESDARRKAEVRPRTSGPVVGRPAASRRPPAKSAIPRTVVTLTHRLPSDSGHLAFNEGERLKLVLEVDDSWLLCCRGDAKGLVPRSAVI